MESIEIKKIVAEQLAKGVELSDIQTILNKEHNVNMTFLELRLLASELDQVDWGQFNKEEEKKDEKAGTDDDLAEDGEESSLDGDGQTVVEVSKIARPGAVMSGSVKFASGASAEWVLDQFGRLGLEKSQGKPTPEDLEQFQTELQKQLTGG